MAKCEQSAVMTTLTGINRDIVVAAKLGMRSPDDYSRYHHIFDLENEAAVEELDESNNSSTVVEESFTVTSIDKQKAIELVVANHYLHRKPPISFAFGLFYGTRLIGVITYGVPASRHAQKSVCPTDPDLAIELNRMWITDEAPKNSASFFVSRTLKQLPPRIVFSYADTAMGHMGYVYRACNFRYAGWTDMERKTPRFDYIPIDPAKHTREAYRSGFSEKVRRKPKVKYWTTTGTKKQAKDLTKLCGWETMSWKKEPPPMSHQQRKM